MTIDTAKAEATIREITATLDVDRYRRYADHIRPRTAGDLFRRALFAYASVHTTWELNVRLYTHIKDYQEWLDDPDKLKDRIIASRAGLYNNRTRYIMDFAGKFWDHPRWFWKNDVETWMQYRNRLQVTALGLGPAKSSFVVEMAYLDTCEVVCSDTHFYRAYGVPPNKVNKVSDKEEKMMEQHWLSTCQSLSVPSAIARWAKWDRLMGYSEPRYWSHVLEPVNYHDVLGGSNGKS